MIYTIGHELSYLRAIADVGAIEKIGQRLPCEQFPEGYEGGYAFRTFAEAQQRINEKYPASGFVVFGMKAHWETDVEGGYLLNDSEIVVLPTPLLTP